MTRRTPLRRFGKRGPRWLRRKKPLRKLGRVGRMQMEWNAMMMRKWRARYGEELRSCIGGAREPLQVGHIEDISLSSHLRTTESNVAPITAKENRDMKYDLVLRSKYQEIMRRWVVMGYHPVYGTGKNGGINQ